MGFLPFTFENDKNNELGRSDLLRSCHGFCCQCERVGGADRNVWEKSTEKRHTVIPAPHTTVGVVRYRLPV